MDLKTVEKNELLFVMQREEKIRITANVERALKIKGISKKDLSELMDKKPGEISKILSGKHNFTIDMLIAIAYYTDHKLTDFIY